MSSIRCSSDNFRRSQASPISFSLSQSSRPRNTSFPATRDRTSQQAIATVKLQTQEPVTFSKFFISFIVQSCKLYVHFFTGIKALMYLVIVFVGSVLRDLIHRSRKFQIYLARPDNIVTAWFVDYSHVWTFLILTAFVYWTSYLYSGGKTKEVLRNLFRSSFGLLVYYFVTFIFKCVTRRSGFCSNDQIGDREFCWKEGHRWLSFDIPHEAFSLIYFSLIIMEETSVFWRWENLGMKLKVDPSQTLIAPQQTNKNVDFVKDIYDKFNSRIQVSFVWLTFLCMIWDAMLMANSFFMQSLPQKLTGAFVAVVVWFFCYRFWFPRVWPYLPGKGILRSLTRPTRT